MAGFYCILHCVQAHTRKNVQCRIIKFSPGSYVYQLVKVVLTHLHFFILVAEIKASVLALTSALSFCFYIWFLDGLTLRRSSKL